MSAGTWSGRAVGLTWADYAGGHGFRPSADQRDRRAASALQPSLAAIRERWDLAASLGAQPHVTVLFPFLPPDAWPPDVRRDLAAIAAAQRAFEVRFARVGRFPGASVCLSPGTVGAVHGRSPRRASPASPTYPPYGGAFDAGHPAPDDRGIGGRAARRHRVRGRGQLPFTHRVRRLEVLVEGGDGPLAGRAGVSRSASDRDELAVLAPGDPQAIADLADGRVRPDRARIAGIRLPSPRGDRARARSIAAAQASAERSARTRRTRSIWRRSPSGSIRWSRRRASPRRRGTG